MVHLVLAVSPFGLSRKIRPLQGTEGSAPLRPAAKALYRDIHARRGVSRAGWLGPWGFGFAGDRSRGSLVLAAAVAAPGSVKKASLSLRDPIYSSGYIRRVPVKGADTPRNEVHGMCFEFAGMDAG
jgi:hypothetical protein